MLGSGGAPIGLECLHTNKPATSPMMTEDSVKGSAPRRVFPIHTKPMVLP